MFTTGLRQLVYRIKHTIVFVHLFYWLRLNKGLIVNDFFLNQEYIPKGCQHEDSQ